MTIEEFIEVLHERMADRKRRAQYFAASSPFSVAEVEDALRVLDDAGGSHLASLAVEYASLMGWHPAKAAQILLHARAT